ncbi:MAG: PAS domain S-box protein, partial [Actinomycetes bacterium]
MGIDRARPRDGEVARAAEVVAELSDVVYALRLEPDMAFEYVSPSVEALVGYTPAEHYADPLLGTKLVDPRDADIHARATQVGIGESVEFTVRWRAKDGGTVWTTHRCRKQRRGDGSAVLYGAARDVSADHDLAERLAGEQERYRLLAENAADFVLQVSADMVIEWVSPSVTSVIGWTPQDMVGRPPSDFFPSEAVQAMEQTKQRVMLGEQESGRRRIRCADGSDRWVSRTIQPVTDDAGAVVSVVGGFRDVQAEVEAEQRLATSEHQYRLLAENSTDVVYQLDADSRVVWVSPSVESVLGWTPEQWLSTRIEGLAHPDDLGSLAAWRQNVLAGFRSGLPVGPLEIRCRTGAGGYRWMSLQARPTIDDNGVPTGAVVGVRDVHEQVLARREVVASRARFATMFAAHDAMMLLVDPQTGAIVDANRAAERFYGYSHDQLTQMVISDINVLPPSEVKAHWREALDGQRNAFVFPHRLADDTVRQVQLHSSPIDDGGRILLFSIIRDVTEELANRDSLAASERRYQLLAENATDVVFQGSNEGVLTWLSPSVTALLGWAPQDMAGHPFVEFVHPEDRPQVKPVHEGLLQGRSGEFEARLRTASGGFVWVAVLVQPVFDASGTVVSRSGG